MTQTKIAPLKAAAPAGEPADGRRQRSERSRAQIIEAMFQLIREGDMSPSAAKVAERAQVGLRTVFRHFEDMDSLYVEMAEQITTEVMPKILAPFVADEWRDQLMEHLHRRIDIYEHILPIRVSANIRRFQSGFLMEEYRRTLMMERTALESLLPESVNGDPVLFAAIETAFSFQSWRRLRQDSELSAAQAADVFRLTMERLVAP